MRGVAQLGVDDIVELLPRDEVNRVLLEEVAVATEYRSEVLEALQHGV